MLFLMLASTVISEKVSYGRVNELVISAERIGVKFNFSSFTKGTV